MGNTEATLRSGEDGKSSLGTRSVRRGADFEQRNGASVIGQFASDIDKKIDGDREGGLPVEHNEDKEGTVVYTADAASGTVRLRSPRWATEESEGKGAGSDFFSANSRPRFMATPTRGTNKDAASEGAGKASSVSPGVPLPGGAYLGKARANVMAAAAFAVTSQFGIRPTTLALCFALGLFVGLCSVDPTPGGPIDGRLAVGGWAGAGSGRVSPGPLGTSLGPESAGMSSADAAAAALVAARFDNEVHAQLTQEAFQRLRAAGERERQQELRAMQQAAKEEAEESETALPPEEAEKEMERLKTAPPPCAKFYGLNPYTGEEVDGGIRPLLVVVTPTYLRPFQAMYLHRLANTLRMVPPPLLWIVVESQLQAADTAALLRGTGLVYRHIVSTHNMTNIKDRGVHQRNAALAHIEEHRLNGIVYFADDDNVYAPELFDEIRKVK